MENIEPQLITCHSCSESRPASDFHPSLLRRAKLTYHCRGCVKVRNTNRYNKKKEIVIPVITDETKECSKCKVVQSVKEFCTHKLSKDGRQTICKSCYRSSYVKSGLPVGRKPKKIVKLEFEMLA